ncbi:MAG: class I SAM-dependent methyltransferase [Methanotrichaceae archaeon]|nr:class I SAM-dependent methyltransferase [Methanotrichaceae archaeon]
MIEGIDWNDMWRRKVEASSWENKHENWIEFWDRRAEGYDSRVKSNRERQIEAVLGLNIESEDSVLDVGAGPGTFSIPIARKARLVTAVEPSRGMISCLCRNAREEGLENIVPIEKLWEDVRPIQDVAEHDVVIASYSLGMKDIRGALEKMDLLAKRWVYLFHFAGDASAIYRDLWYEAHHEEYRSGPDYIYLINVLHQMGIYANVEVSSEEQIQRFSDLDEAASHWSENLDAPPEAEKAIRDHLSSMLERDGDDLVQREMMRRVKIWWRPDTREAGEI